MRKSRAFQHLGHNQLAASVAFRGPANDPTLPRIPDGVIMTWQLWGIRRRSDYTNRPRRARRAEAQMQRACFLLARCCLAGAVLLIGSSSHLFAQPATAIPPSSTRPMTELSVTAVKWLRPAPLDATCSAEPYDQAEKVLLVNKTGKPGAQVKLYHSAWHLFVCATNLPASTNAKLVIRVAPQSPRNGAAVTHSVTYQFSVSSAGTVAGAQIDADGTAKSFTLRPEDLTAVIARDARSDAGGPQTNVRQWNAELRISLEWLGGYARRDGLLIAWETPVAEEAQAWPAGAGVNELDSWGELVLGPLYPATITSGSAFLDGRGGYLAVPSSPDLSPSEITIEAWVRVTDRSCGTVVSNGSAVSYFLDVCRTLRFGYQGQASALSGQLPLGDRWHHVAVSMSKDGIRQFYLDGVADLLPDSSTERAEGSERPKGLEQLGKALGPLRIGSDRSTNNSYLHGYIRDLRIWNRVRTAEEIRSNAFADLTGAEPGLVALWPLTNGLQDIAGHHDAGLVGEAALAREARDINQFSKPTPQSPRPGPAPLPVAKAWDAHVPMISGPVTVDGLCSPAEYRNAAEIRLEPDHRLFIYVALTPKGLYACTNALFGADDGKSAITLWIDRSAAGRATLDSSALRVQLMPGKKPQSNVANASGFDGPPLAKLLATTYVSPVLRLQDEDQTEPIPWWSGEVFIPLSDLAPWKPGSPLRLAVRYEGTLPAGTNVSAEDQRAFLSGTWPSTFDPTHPASWGLVSTAASPEQKVAAPAGGPVLEIGRLDRGNQYAAPTTADFTNTCDGGLLNNEYLSGRRHKWRAIIDDTPIAAEGTLTKLDFSDEDWPSLHTSHDLDMVMTTTFPSWLAISDRPAGGGQILENEALGIPAFARPLRQDHLTLLGRWIFDCAHADKAHTELHPLYIVESDDIEGWPVLDNRIQETRIARVWMNPNDPFFPYPLPQSFSFDVELPNATGGVIPFYSIQKEITNFGTGSEDQTINSTTVAASVTRDSVGDPIAHVTITLETQIIHTTGNSHLVICMVKTHYRGLFTEFC
jgi:hypothetical protein